MKEEGCPLRMVLERSQDTRKVIRMPNRIRRVRRKAALKVLPGPEAAPMKNMAIRAVRVGNLPLQGTKLLVRTAISRSLGESMMRQPVTPAALQPKPIIMVRACLPQARQAWKGRSRL